MKKVVLIVCFYIMIGGAYLLWALIGPALDDGNHENRVLAECPKLELAMISEYPENFESWMNDNLPFRNQMICLNSMIAYYLFEASTNEETVVGKDNWLFYTEKGEGSLFSTWYNRNRLTQEQLADIADNLLATQKHLEDAGIEFVIFIAPDKEHIYGDAIPDRYGKASVEYAVKQIVDYLRVNTDLRVVYPLEKLQETADEMGDPRLLYRKTDTHWNDLGAYIGARALLEEIGVFLPDVTDENVQITTYQDGAGDLANLLNLGAVIDTGNSSSIEGYGAHAYEIERFDDVEQVFHAIDADPRVVLIRKDSFCNNMMLVLGSQFEKTVMANYLYYSNERLEELNPDVFVLEVVGRHAVYELSTFSY